MAREIVFTDDLDGSHGAEPVRIGWNDVWFEVDLAEANRTKLAEFIETYINAGRPAGREAAPVRRTRATRAPASERIDYATPEHAGEPHRGRVSPEEAAYVRDHLELVNRRLEAEGLRQIDPQDRKLAERYGL